MSSNQHFRHAASRTKLTPEHAAAIRASDAFDKEGLIAWHLNRHHDALVLEKLLHPEDMLPPAPQSPTVPLKGLKPIQLKDMKIGKVHRGRVLRGTFCTKTVKMRSVVNVLEDELGMATMIFMSNVVPMNCSMAQAQRRFPTGLEVAIRDPYLHEHDDGMIGILVEKATDVIILRVPEEVEEESSAKEEEESDSQEDVVPLVTESDAAAEDKRQVVASDVAAEDKRQVVASDVTNHVDEMSKEEAEAAEGQGTPGDDAAVLENPENQNEITTVGETEQEQESRARTTDAMVEKSEDLNDIAKQESAVEHAKLVNHNAEQVKTEQSLPIKGNAVKAGTAFVDGTNNVERSPAGNADIQQQSNVDATADELKADGKQTESNISFPEDAFALRKLGSQYFAQGEWSRAAEFYSKAIARAEKDDELNAQTNENKDEVLLGYSNRAEAYLRMKQYDRACKDAEVAVSRQGKHAKSLYRMGRALMGLDKLEDALHFLEAAYVLAPQDKDLRESLHECRSKLQASAHKKRICSKARKKRQLDTKA